MIKPEEIFTFPSEYLGKNVAYIDADFSFGYNSEFAFDYNKQVKKIILPSKLEGLILQGGTGILSFENLEAYEIDSSNENFATKDGVLYTKDFKTLIAYPPAKIGETLEIPAGVENLGSETYWRSSFTFDENIKKVVFPSTMKAIRSHAAFSNSSVSEVVFPEGMEYIEEMAFWDCENLKEVTIPKSVTHIGELAFGSNTKDYMGTIVPTDLVIRGYADSEAERYAKENEITFEEIAEEKGPQQGTYEQFTYELDTDGEITLTSYSGDDTELTLPSEIDGNPVTEVGTEIFDILHGGNETITKLTVPGSIKKIGSGAFAGCYALEEAVLEDGVEVLGDSAFGSCTSLQTVLIPSSVNDIGNYVFCRSYASGDTSIIDVEIRCYRDSTAHKYAMGDNFEKYVYRYSLIGEESSLPVSVSDEEESVVQNDTPSITTSEDSKPDKTKNPITGIVVGIGSGVIVILTATLLLVKFKVSKK